MNEVMKTEIQSIAGDLDSIIENAKTIMEDAVRGNWIEEMDGCNKKIAHLQEHLIYCKHEADNIKDQLKATQELLLKLVDEDEISEIMTKIHIS
tara:strand:- start:699 stop:980 length:282 start_codon:yes stop_codon:yes gene_type:complete